MKKILLLIVILFLNLGKGEAFFPKFEDISKQWQEQYSKLKYLECEIKWENPALSIRIWKSQERSLEEWVELKNGILQVVGACLRNGHKVIASTFANAPSQSIIDCFFYSPTIWKSLGVSWNKKRYVCWNDQLALKIGEDVFCLYLANERFYPLGARLGTVSLGWGDFVYLGNYYLPTSGWITNLSFSRKFQIKWGRINTRSQNIQFSREWFDARYSAVGSFLPISCKPLLNLLRSLP
ncbi:hypothetical protein SAMN04488516_1083 [Desulfonauticus submarinus]|uniref:Uncharacterized protein n=1 Tax=Desulfonauticus submarinus TaxID=206665 RepID=A0A1H0EIR4_9BACT|nr:hypothetical protein [Desulfonauticus submarinus]SDN82169.1 hypothetical protein SAMN04488516_1083 [Desulfonauticus submarinus]